MGPARAHPRSRGSPMKTILCATFVSLSLTMAAALPAEASFILQSQKTPNSDQTHYIAQDITVKTTGETVDISDWTIQYYFYEPNLPVNWTMTLSPSRPGQFIT